MTRAGLLVAACLGVGTAAAQPGAAGFFNPLSASRNGIHLYGVSISGGYYSGDSPFGSTGSGSPSAITGATMVTSGAANFGWSHSGDRSSLAASYSPSYVAYPEHTELNALNHALSLNWNRKVGGKWSFHTGVAALVSNLQQTYFSANAFGLAASLPTTFDGLSSAILSGAMTDSQLASALTGASASLLPEQTYLYGRRIASTSAQTGFSYAPSGRSSFHGTVSLSRIQGLKSGGTTDRGAAPIIPQTTAGTATLGWGYALSPRTHIGLDAGTSRTFSRLLDGYANTAGFSIGRTMSAHWFVQGRAGAGVTVYRRQTLAAPQKLRYTAGGDIGYKLRSHTLIGSFNRSLADSYGLGAGSTDAALAGWAWKSPGSSWSLSANYGYQRLNGIGVYSNESWRAMGGIARALGPHAYISVQYAYFTSPQSLVTSGGTRGAENGVQMSISWSPSQYR